MFPASLAASALGRHLDLSAPIEVLQQQINAWLVEYNTERPHQEIGRRPPILKLFQFRLAQILKSNPSLNFDLRQMLWQGTKSFQKKFSVG